MDTTRNITGNTKVLVRHTLNLNSIVSGGDNYENHRRSHPKG